MVNAAIFDDSDAGVLSVRMAGVARIDRERVGVSGD
jgi:hypothetical protein